MPQIRSLILALGLALGSESVSMLQFGCRVPGHLAGQALAGSVKRRA